MIFALTCLSTERITAKATCDNARRSPVRAHFSLKQPWDLFLCLASVVLFRYFPVRGDTVQSIRVKPSIKHRQLAHTPSPDRTHSKLKKLWDLFFRLLYVVLFCYNFVFVWADTCPRTKVGRRRKHCQIRKSAPTVLNHTKNSGSRIIVLPLRGSATDLEVPGHCRGQSSVVGELKTNAHLQFEIQNPSSDAPACPAIAFYSPVECLECLEKCFHYTTGFHSNLRQHVGPLKPMGFQYQTKDGPDQMSTVIAAAGWPDTTGGPVLSSPYITDVDQLMLLLSFILCLTADCLVIAVKRLDRAQTRSLTQLMRRKMHLPKWLIVFHDLETREEFEVELLIFI